MNKSLRPWPLLMLLTLPACATQTPSASLTPTVATSAPPAPSACTAFKRLTFDRLNDTLTTIQEIKDYDAARDAVCGVGK